MMLIPDAIFSFILALIISFIAALIIRKGVPRKGFWLFFLVIFLATWAGGIWGKPPGGSLVPKSWLPFLLSGVAAALILSWWAPKEPQIGRRAVLDRKETRELLEEVEQQREIKQVAYITVNILLWAIIVLLLAAIILRYTGVAD